MLGVRPMLLLSLAALASAQAIDSLQECGKTCYNNVVNMAGSFSCAAMDFNCLCRVDSFTSGIHDCALEACGADYMPTVTNAVNAQCATAAPGWVPPTPSTSSAPAPAPTTTEAPTPTSSSSSEVTSTSTTTSTLLSSSSSSSTATSSATSTAAPTRAVASSTSATSTTAAATSSAAAASEPSGGLSEAAKIGVGVGVGAAVIAILALVACVFLRKRRARQLGPRTDRFKISHPAPSDAASYTRDNNSDHDDGSGALEMKSRRYEDMLPRQQPRQMV
ncbi:hypothetical protein N658DRAFT_568756 [Parathielavia hyrcaniae]|uniref:CFEM domain-containing protein n=1 Tax=Parathielavia hyrcaniae TaxID=113614 RepID=A0AAN6SZD3_9PEZI|nr:hypothetical protein N658DRAFT_568756 [Parathielavia hyrcaniae]